VDIRPDTLNLDERLVEKALTARTRAIVPVHYAGVPCAMDPIMDLASRHGLRVIEDTAQALLSSYNGRKLGTIGHAGCLSFHETKNIISGEGGALLLNDPALIERAEIIWEKGTNRGAYSRGEADKYSWMGLGSSFYPSELVSAFLFAQLEKAENIIAARRKIFAQYATGLKPIAEQGFFDLPSEFCLENSNAHLFYIVCRSEKERSQLMKHLRSDGILAVFHYVPLHSSSAGVIHGKTVGDMTHTETVSRRLLRLPLYRDLGEEDVRNVISAIAAFFMKSASRGFRGPTTDLR
jgi:dTDP-4-amino-4,6-dideoxygalactose transaminase